MSVPLTQEHEMSQAECPKTGLLKKIPFALFIYYKLATFVPAFIGIYAIYTYAGSLLWVFAYISIFVVHMAIIYKIKCTHCTYYMLPGDKLHCMWLWGVPKIFRKDTRPESGLNKVYVPFGMAMVAFFPVYWLLNNWALLALYFVSMAVLVASLFLFTCTRCTYFECTHNQVSRELKDRYLADIADSADAKGRVSD
jgi:predicted neutral ceramidase superfamily lipid hydrolase